MLSSVLPDTSTLSSFIIRRLYTTTIPLLPLLVASPSLGRKEIASINASLSVFLRSNRSAGEGGARGVVISWPDSQLALCLHWCHWDSAHNGQITLSWYNFVLFFQLGFYCFCVLLLKHPLKTGFVAWNSHKNQPGIAAHCADLTQYSVLKLRELLGLLALAIEGNKRWVLRKYTI